MFLLLNRLRATFVVDGNHGSCGDNLDGDGAVNSVVESAVKICVKVAGKLRDDRTSFLHRTFTYQTNYPNFRYFSVNLYRNGCE